MHRPSLLHAMGAVVALVAVLACTEDPVRSVESEALTPAAPVLASASVPPAASLSVKVTVPASMRSSPFNVDRFLTIPPNFSIAVYARISGARFMATAPNGDLLVSNPGAGSVYLVRASTTGGDPTVSTWASGLYKPHDIVFHTIDGVTWVYVAEADKIARYTYNSASATGQGRQVLITGLPSLSTPELQGGYGHELKNIALDNANKLYVSIASTCNVCLSDTQSNPVRASVYVYNADGTGGRIFARGLRNAEGLAMVPGTNVLWVVVNNRDNIAYSFQNDWDGDGTNDYKKVMQSYVDNHPPEEFTKVRDGGNYGWPFCNPNPDSPSGMNGMPFDRDVEQNADGSRLDCATADRISKGIQAHSAPLGVTFLQGTNAPAEYREGVMVPLHGSWNRSSRTGAKLIYFAWDAVSQLPDQQIDLVSGWLVSGSYWGRPVDAAVGTDGGIYISDDQSGTIYKLSYAAPPPPLAPPPPPPTNNPPVASFTWSCPGLTCTLDASSSTDDGQIVLYSWNLGRFPNPVATGRVVSATYPHEGNRSVVLTVTDNGDASNSIARTVVVGASPPPPPPLSLIHI